MRSSRNSGVLPEELLVPFDVSKFGGADDPCFGKEYDLTTDECQSCGDVEVCSIAFVRTLGKKRLEYEQELPMRDLEIDKLEMSSEVYQFVTDKVALGFKLPRAISMASKKFHYHPDKILEIYNSQNLKSNGH
jgi:hypothetical protein